jgi:hypothetical protein
MSPSAAIQRALLPATDSSAAGAANATVSANATVARCSSKTLGSVTFDKPMQIECNNASSYSFFLLSRPPSSAEMKRICHSTACRNTVQAIERAVPSECQLPNGGEPMYLYQDVLLPVTRTCAFSGGNDSTSGSSHFSNSTINPPIESSTGAGSSNLGVGSMVAMIGGAIGFGLLAAFVAMQLKRRRKDAAMNELAEPSRDQMDADGLGSMTPLDEVHDVYSPRSNGEFGAIAMASKVSSNHSRASTVSSKHSRGSHLDVGDHQGVVRSSQMDTPAAKTLRLTTRRSLCFASHRPKSKSANF